MAGATCVSYGELNDASSGVAAWFLEQGLRPGDRLAVYWPNSIEAVTLFFGCFKAGLIAVPINVRLKAPEIAYILGHSEPSIWFAQPEFKSIAKRAAAIAGTNIPLEIKLPDIALSRSRILPQVNPSDDCAIMYTSGTTARPKGVTHTHASLLHCARLMLSMIGDAGPVSMTTTQMAHLSGLACILLPSILSGMTTVLSASFDAALALDLIESFQVTYTGGLPAMVALMVEEQARRPRDVRSLKAFIGGGDSVPLGLQDRFTDLFGLPVRELIGMTESCPTCWNTADDVRPGSLGRPRDGVEVKIAPLNGWEPSFSAGACACSKGLEDLFAQSSRWDHFRNREARSRRISPATGRQISGRPGVHRSGL